MRKEKMNIEQYKLYSTEELILDEYFVKLAKGQSVNGVTLEQFQAYYSEKDKEIDLAIAIINGLQTKKIDLPIGRKEKILNRIFHQNKVHFRINLFRYAAAVLLIIGLGASSLFIFNQQTEIEDFASSNQVQSENAELILADGKRVEINTKQSKIEYTADGTSVSLNDTSRLEQKKTDSEESFNQLMVPYGKRSSILLSDGSLVKLNSGSRLVYPPVFNKKNREVYLEGEAYFEISKDINRPFFVRTDEFKIKVLGTKFAVQAFKKEKEYNTLLVEGSVSLSKNSNLFSKEQVLKPNQKATLTNSDDDFNITEVDDIQSQIAWIYGYLIFKNEDLKSLSEKISRYYNINIEVFTTSSDSKFSGKLDLKESPDRVIEGLSTIFKVKYEKQNGTIVFKD